MRRLLGLVLLLVIGTGGALLPTSALAHSSVVGARPEAGAELSTPPGVVDLQFSEPIKPKLSRLLVTGPSGHTFDWQAVGPQELQAQVTTIERGIYTVRWTTVSSVDGHSLRGTYQFGVGVPVHAAAAVGGATDPQPSDLLIAVFRAVEYFGLFAAIGISVIGRLARRAPAIDISVPSIRWPLLVALLGGLAVVLGESFSAAGNFNLSVLPDYLFSGPPGYARVARIALEALALMLVAPVGEFAILPALAALLAIAAAGHAVAVKPAWLGLVTDGLHLAAGATWAGGLLVLAGVAIRVPRQVSARLLHRFSFIALPAFAISVLLGALRGTQELSRLTDLVTSSYGRVLVAKIALVTLVFAVALLVRRAELRWLRADATLAISIVVLTAGLAAYPLPPRRAQEADASDRLSGAAAAWPRPGDLTMAAGVGRTVVGFTLRPGLPGPNQVLLFLLPSAGDGAAAGINAQLTIDGRAVRLQTCGQTCRSGSVDLSGPGATQVQISGADKGTASFAIPSLPATDATAMFQATQARIHQLRSYAMSEVFGPVQPPLMSAYQFEQPDRMDVRAASGAETIWVGDTIYRRDSSTAPWSRQVAGGPLKADQFIWDDGTPQSVRVIGESAAGPGHLTEISFFELRDQTPLWFRLWIDDNLQVRKSQMRAQAHFMDDSYSQFDIPFGIKPPA